MEPPFGVYSHVFQSQSAWDRPEVGRTANEVVMLEIQSILTLWLGLSPTVGETEEAMEPRDRRIQKAFPSRYRVPLELPIPGTRSFRTSG